MSQPSYPYASVKIKAREQRLLNKEKSLRLIHAKDAYQAMKLLADFGYAEADQLSPFEFEKLLAAEEKQTFEFINEITPNPAITDLFFLKYDYFNAKTYMKAYVKGFGVSKNTVVNMGTMDLGDLYEKIKEKRYTELPPEMRDAVKDLEKHFVVKPDVSLIDITLDAAYSKQVARELKQIDDAFVREYFSAYFDFINIAATVRLKRTGAPREIFERALMYGGSIDRQTLKRAYDIGIAELSAYLARGNYREKVIEAFEYLERTGQMLLFEKAKSDYLMSLIRRHQQNAFSIAPVFSYMIAKAREIQIVRMIMIAKINDMADIPEIMPELY